MDEDKKVRLIAEHCIRHIKPIFPYTEVKISSSFIRDGNLIILLEDGRKYSFFVEVEDVMQVEVDQMLKHPLSGGDNKPPTAELREPEPAAGGKKTSPAASKRKASRAVKQ